MADYDWPADIVPFGVTFYLQPHTGGSESPFSRATKVYALSAPRWVCRLSVRGGDSVRWGSSGSALWGQRMDAFLAKLKGRQNRVRLWDFRRPNMATTDWAKNRSNLAAAVGDTIITITNLSPYSRVYAGDYIGGDGRPHIILDDVDADASGNATVTFEPPLKTALAVGAMTHGSGASGLFRLVSDDAGANPSEVGQLTQYDLDFVEDL